MALQKQNLFLNFNKGVDTSTDSKLVIPSKFARLDNFELGRVTTLRQRPGLTQQTLTALTGSAGIVNVRQLHTLGSEILLEADSGLHSFLQDHTASRDGINASGLLKTFERGQVDYADVAESQQDQQEVDAALTSPSGLECWVWCEPIRGSAARMVFYRVIDSQTRAIVQQGTVANSAGTDDAYHPRVVVRDSAGASSFYIYYAYTTGGVNSIRTKSLTIAAAAFVPSALSAETNIIAANDAPFDCWVDLTGADFVALAFYRTSTADVTITILSGADGATILTSTSTGTVVAPAAISVTTIASGGFTYALAIYTVGNAVRAFSVKSTGATALVTALAAPTSPGRVAVLPSPFTAGKALVFFDFNPYTAGAIFPHDIGYVKCDANGANPGTPSIFAKSIVLAARPVAYHGTVGGAFDVCVPGALLSDIQPTLYLFKFGGASYEVGFGGFSLADASHTSPRVLARLFPGECGHLKAQYAAALRMPTCLAVS